MPQILTDVQVVERILRYIAALTEVSYENLKQTAKLETLGVVGAKLLKLTFWLKELRNRETERLPRPRITSAEVEDAKTVRGVVQFYFARVHQDELSDAETDELIRQAKEIAQ